MTVPAGVSPQAVKVTAGTRDVSGGFRQMNDRAIAGPRLGPRQREECHQREWSKRTAGVARGDELSDHGTGDLGSLAAAVHLPDRDVRAAGWQQARAAARRELLRADGRAVRLQRCGTPADAAQPFKPLPSTTALPADVAKTTTITGATVNFIVRVETGTMNRGIYQNAILHDPTVDPAADAVHAAERLEPAPGRACTAAAARAAGTSRAAAQGVNILDAARLGEGYALFINTLNHPTNSCNAFLAGETTMMGKEHFIETFGVPLYTMSTGGSGGAYTSLQIADAFPGLFDGVDIRATFPDALCDRAVRPRRASADALLHGTHRIRRLTDAQKVGDQRLSGHEGVHRRREPGAADRSGARTARTSRATSRRAGTPPCRETLRYDPVTNPKGARPTVFDVARNIYGVNPATGAALRPYDNVGVQYGLNALNAGAITTAQFLDLNETDRRLSTRTRTTSPRAPSATCGAIKRAYQSRPDARRQRRADVDSDLRQRHVERDRRLSLRLVPLRAARAAAPGERRQLRQHGDVARHVRRRRPRSCSTKWMAAYKADTSSDPQRVKVLRAKPAEARRRLLRQVHAAAVHPHRCRSAASRFRNAASSTRCIRTRGRKPAARWPPTS